MIGGGCANREEIVGDFGCFLGGDGYVRIGMVGVDCENAGGCANWGKNVGDFGKI